jgi:hypothetical protein
MKRYRDTRLSTDENLLSRLSPEDEFSFDDGSYDEDEELAFTEDEDITDEDIADEIEEDNVETEETEE